MGAMSKKPKEICKWEKGSFDKQMDQLFPIVRDPKFACKTCGRVASARKYLCKALKLPVPSD